ncbi:MAG: 30S ribosomal protein S4 [Athalassotoga sp.]|uniref:30S ribosomal protein S4 n=1 Tax=Athalassotoga sp. TaxID=2022597 RepID=UPI001771B27F|nr:30S ribosomal protein S4 [Mesoaciditoga lauensis]
MARYTDPVCKLCRREGKKLFLKGEKCYSPKCPVEKRPYAPGQHGKDRLKMTQYARQLRSKQTMKRTYGVLERQFRRYFAEAVKTKGVTGTMLIRKVESRLDNVVFRLGFAISRSHARQLVNHGHILVNGRRIDIPSYELRPGDEIELHEKIRSNADVKKAIESRTSGSVSPWLEVNYDLFKGKFVRMPDREELELPLDVQDIVELYSK